MNRTQEAAQRAEEERRPGVTFRLYVVTDNAIAGPKVADKLLAISKEAGERVAFYFRDDPETGSEHRRIEDHLRSRVLWPTELHPQKDTCGGVGLRTMPKSTGVHLKAKELPVAKQARALGRGFFAASVHSVEEAIAARDAGCDFVVFGHVYDTPSKHATPARGLDALSGVCRAVSIPVFAIGGVTPARVSECRAAGAWGVATIRALLEPEDPRPALRAFLKALSG